MPQTVQLLLGKRMEELKSSTRVLLLSAAIMIVILLTGPLGYKFGLVPLMPSLASLMVSLVGALLVLIAGFIFVVISIRNDQQRNRNILLLTIGLSLVPMLIMGPQILKARSVPPIHDITTDTLNPPEFEVIVKRRVHAPNTLEYGTKELPADELAALQKDAYPGVKPKQTELDLAKAVSRAEEVLEAQGMDVVNVDTQAGLVEATATTFWFGFKDDLVVRVTENDDGSLVDVRSVSRVGQSDLGANAARIMTFLDAF